MKREHGRPLQALNAGFISLSAPDEVAWARLTERNRDLQGSWFIDRNEFETLKTLRGFEPLGSDEPHLGVVSES